MATKNTELSHKYDLLIEAYKVSLGLSTSELTEKSSIESSIPALDNSIQSLKQSIEIAAKKVEELTDVRTETEINEEINHITYIAEGLNELKNTEDLIKALRALDPSTLTDEQREELIQLTNIKAEIVMEYGAAITELSTKFGTTTFKDLVEKIEDHKRELNDTITKHKKLTLLINQKNEKENELATLTNRLSELNTKSISVSADTLENFKKFLKAHKFSTEHAAEIYESYKTGKPLNIKRENTNTNNNHRNLKAAIKKVIVPFLATGAGVGVASGIIASSGLTAGAAAWPFVVMSSQALTVFANSLIGLVVGTGITATTLAGILVAQKVKHLINVAKAKDTIESYSKGNSLDSLPLTKLLEKCEKSNHTIMNLSQGNWFTKAIKFIPKHFVIFRNRIRMRTIKDYQEQIVRAYNKIEADPKYTTQAAKAEALLPLKELCETIDGFIDRYSLSSKLHSFLTCKETGNHSHPKVQGLDIIDTSALINIALRSEPEAIKENLKQAKKDAKNYEKNIEVGVEVLNTERFFTKMLGYDRTYGRFVGAGTPAVSVTGVTKLTDGKTAIVHLENGENVEVLISDIPEVDKLESVKISKNKTLYNFEDGSSKEIKKPSKSLLELETSRLVLLDKLKNDTLFVEELKTEGHNTKTIKSLISKLTDWLTDTNSKLKVSTSSNAGKLYSSSMIKIQEEAKAEKVFRFDPSEEPIILPVIDEEATAALVFDYTT